MKITLNKLRTLIREVVAESNGARLSWEEACEVHEDLMKKHVFSINPASLARAGMPSVEIAQKIQAAADQVTQELPRMTGWSAEELWRETVARKKSSLGIS